MKLGFDVDGVLANFCIGYERLFVEVTGRNTFAPYDAETGPISWNWPTEHYGYTAEETTEVWNRIKNSREFCQGLPALPDAKRLAAWVMANSYGHDIYFITSRVGPHAKVATENWLNWLFGFTPTVLIVKGELKGQVCAGLGLELFVEDNIDNARGIAAAGVKTYLIDRAYNQGELPINVVRCYSISAALETIK